MGMKDNIQIIFREEIPMFQIVMRAEKSNRNEINYSQNRSQSSRVNTSQRGRAKEIFLNRNQSAREKFPRRRSKRLLSKVILQEKTLLRSEGI
jgi:hypothetical protein